MHLNEIDIKIDRLTKAFLTAKTATAKDIIGKTIMVMLWIRHRFTQGEYDDEDNFWDVYVEFLVEIAEADSLNPCPICERELKS